MFDGFILSQKTKLIETQDFMTIAWQCVWSVLTLLFIFDFSQSHLYMLIHIYNHLIKNKTNSLSSLQTVRLHTVSFLAALFLFLFLFFASWCKYEQLRSADTSVWENTVKSAPSCVHMHPHTHTSVTWGRGPPVLGETFANISWY